MSEFTVKDGRIWFQKKTFQEYDLLLPYGMTDVTDPLGALTAIREPHPKQRRATIIVDMVRGEPALPGFSIETRLFNTLNFMLGTRAGEFNFQVHLGELCDVPDDYYASNLGLAWELAQRADLTLPRTALIEGDNQPVALQVPWMAQLGPIPLDFGAEFLSARTIAESEAITGLAFLDVNCGGVGGGSQRAGDVGYACTEFLSGSVGNIANVWYTKTGAETWLLPSAQPFAGGENITDIVVLGSKKQHRVVVSGDKGNVAYCDVTTLGTTNWVSVAFGSPSKYITRMFWLNFNHLYGCTNDGYVYISNDGSVNWTEKLTNAAVPLHDVTAHRKGLVYTVGDDETIYKSKDFGDSWDALTSPSVAGYTACHITPQGVLFVGNDAGEIFGTVDNGNEWNASPPQGITATEVRRIKSLNDTEIWAACNTASGGRVVRSTNNGSAFRLWNLNLASNNGLNAMAVVDDNYCIVGGEPVSGQAFVTKTNPTIIGL